MESKPAHRARWCDEKWQIWLSAGVLAFRPCDVCNSPLLPALPGAGGPLKFLCREPSPCLNGHYTFNPNNQVTPAQIQWQYPVLMITLAPLGYVSLDVLYHGLLA